MPDLATTDVAFYDLVHSALGIQTPANVDQRQASRHEYRCWQLVAPYINGQLPDQALFERVRCRDLSPSGFSFMTPQPPDHQQLIVALGTVPFLFVVAKVQRQMLMHTSQGPEYLIGCSFTGRIDR